MYRPEPIDAEKWLRRAEDDEKNFTEDVDLYLDKLGVIGRNLFNLTLDNQRSNVTFRSVTVHTGEQVLKGMILALCPELESFVTFTIWMGSAKKPNPDRLKAYKEVEKFFLENNPKEICKITGNYRLSRKQYCNVLFYYANVQIKNKEKIFYEWERVPFIKRSAETFAYFPSPIFMSTVPSSEPNVKEDQVSYFTMIFKPIKITNNIVTISVYSCTKPFQRETDALVYDNSLLEKLKQMNNKVMIGLFEDKIFRKQNNFPRELVLLNTTEELDGNDIAGFFTAQRMYYNYLINRELFICTDKELLERCRNFFFQIERDYSKKVTMPFNMFTKLFLEAYFVKLDEKWYYKPFIFNELSKVEFKEFIKYISLTNESEKNKIELLKLRKKYYRYRKYLEFLNFYNQYSKRVLIENIKIQFGKNGVWKWKV